MNSSTKNENIIMLPLLTLMQSQSNIILSGKIYSGSFSIQQKRRVMLNAKLKKQQKNITGERGRAQLKHGAFRRNWRHRPFVLACHVTDHNRRKYTRKKSPVKKNLN